MPKLKQTGFNPNFPLEAETWKPGEKVPEWLSDRAKISGFDGEGNIMLDIKTDERGRIHIRDTYRPIDLVTLENSESIIIYGEGFSLKVLNQEQIDFLYEEE